MIVFALDKWVQNGEKKSPISRPVVLDVSRETSFCCFAGKTLEGRLKLLDVESPVLGPFKWGDGAQRISHQKSAGSRIERGIKPKSIRIGEARRGVFTIEEVSEHKKPTAGRKSRFLRDAFA
jgi:hypothetical protein